jgi:HSP20 family molecular chaperone IbpA
MQPDMIQMMRTQVRAIHVALTGSDVPEPEPPPTVPVDATPPPTPPAEDVMQRFLELEAVSRTLPSVASRVPPFAFSPPLDVLADHDGVVLELLIPGVAREDVEVNRIPGGLAVRGIRREPSGPTGAFHIESSRGPFYRAIPLPYPLEAPPKVELERGVLRIHVPAGPVPANKNQDTRRK